MDELLENLKEMINETQKMTQAEYIKLVNLVNNIIRHRISDESLIEHTLDRILDLIFIDDNNRLELFFKLVDYYRLINEKASLDYIYIYMDNYIEHEKENLKENDDGYRLTRNK